MKAKNSAIIVAMALTGANVQQTSDACKAALADMQEELGNEVYSEYTWNPFDGMLA